MLIPSFEEIKSSIAPDTTLSLPQRDMDLLHATIEINVTIIHHASALIFPQNSCAKQQKCQYLPLMKQNR